MRDLTTQETNEVSGGRCFICDIYASGGGQLTAHGGGEGGSADSSGGGPKNPGTMALNGLASNLNTVNKLLFSEKPTFDAKKLDFNNNGRLTDELILASGMLSIGLGFIPTPQTQGAAWALRAAQGTANVTTVGAAYYEASQ